MVKQKCFIELFLVQPFSRDLLMDAYFHYSRTYIQDTSVRLTINLEDNRMYFIITAAKILIRALFTVCEGFYFSLPILKQICVICTCKFDLPKPFELFDWSEMVILVSVVWDGARTIESINDCENMFGNSHWASFIKLLIARLRKEIQM